MALLNDDLISRNEFSQCVFDCDSPDPTLISLPWSLCHSVWALGVSRISVMPITTPDSSRPDSTQLNASCNPVGWFTARYHSLMLSQRLVRLKPTQLSRKNSEHAQNSTTDKNWPIILAFQSDWIVRVSQSVFLLLPLTLGGEYRSSGEDRQGRLGERR